MNNTPLQAHEDGNLNCLIIEYIHSLSSLPEFEKEEVITKVILYYNY